MAYSSCCRSCGLCDRFATALPFLGARHSIPLGARRVANWPNLGSGCPDQGLRAQNNVASFKWRMSRAKSASPP